MAAALVAAGGSTKLLSQFPATKGKSGWLSIFEIKMLDGPAGPEQANAAALFGAVANLSTVFRVGPVNTRICLVLRLSICRQ